LYSTPLKYPELHLQSIHNLPNLPHLSITQHLKFKLKKSIHQTSPNNHNNYKSQPLLQLNHLSLQYTHYTNTLLNNLQLNLYTTQI
ncbi:DUF3744 domain-containing protein, partial [Staphylococcus aureus]|uniref:DUF3744 domain-containing protein n=1 Tax=Staphylococcus aureus TaxID=1280 RepID=UPI00164293E4